MRVAEWTGPRGRGMVLGLGLLGASLGLGPAAAGQRVFVDAFDTATVDETHYSADQCLAVLLRGGLAWRDRLKPPPTDRVYPDTLAWQWDSWRRPLAPPLVSAAQRCGAKFVEPQTPLTEWWHLLLLYLAAQRERDASALVERRLAAARPGTAEWHAVIDSAVLVYTGGNSEIPLYPSLNPHRVDLEVALREREARELTDLKERLFKELANLDRWRHVGDTAVIRAKAEQALAHLKAASAEEFRYVSQGLPRDHVVAKVFLYILEREAAGSSAEQAEQDSLKKSTASYVALKQGLFRQFVGTGLPMPIGERAPTLEGDVWLPQEAARQARPRAGKVSLVLFLDHPNPMYIALVHRLTERFPALEVTVVTPGVGSFRSLPPTTAAEEAQHRSNEWAKSFYPVPVTLVMTTIPKVQLPPPDGRWLPQPGWQDPNRAHYAFGGTWNVGWSGTAFLVDQQGVIVYASNVDGGVKSSPLGPEAEKTFAALMDVLLHRPVTALNTPGGAP